MSIQKKILNVLIIILICNIVIAIVKIFLGIALSVNSLTADGLHAITDAADSIIGIIAVKIAYKPADKNHPYGHYKFETIASMFIGLMLFYITGQIVYNAVMWFMSLRTPSFSLPGFISLLVTLGLNIFIATYEYRKGKVYNSEVLVADSIHTRSDIFISFGVILTMVLIKLGLPPIIDPILSLIIAIIVFRSCLSILKSTINVLVDKRAIDEEKIMEIVYQINPDIVNIHKIRSRGHNNYLYIDMHIILDPSKTVKEAHALSHLIESVLASKLGCGVELNAHIEPDERNCHYRDIIT